MVVLDSNGMLSSSGNQYLQPDYLSPLPTTLDAKKSPLALLAQTCSQIGADSPSTKSILPSLEKKKSSSSTTSNERAGQSPTATATNLSKSAPRTTPPSADSSKLAFKPYETNVITKKEDRPSSKGEDGRKSVPESRAPSRKSSNGSPSAKSEDSEKDKSEGASPIIRSGMEILAGHPKDMPLGTYKPPGYGIGCCPPGLDPSNPAFRPPYAGAPFSHHLLGNYGSTPYLSYARVKTASGSEALVPVCKDPYCTGCQFSMHGTNMMGQCPAGCTQCEHQKYGLAAAALGMLPPGLPYGPLGRPYVCSWMVGEAYCGKRFTTPDELLQHLRTHTAPTSATDAAAAASLLYRYPNPPLSPLSAARFHPYAKPSGLPPSPYSAFNPTALSPYYSPYSLYGQRLGAAVHP